MTLFTSKINHLLALTEADRDATQALARGEAPCLVVDADFFAKLGADVAISSTPTIVVGEAVGVLEAMAAQGKRPFVLYAVEHVQDGLPIIEWLTEHAVPYLSRRLHGVSAGDGMGAKRPELITLEPPALVSAVAPVRCCPGGATPQDPPLAADEPSAAGPSVAEPTTVSCP